MVQFGATKHDSDGHEVIDHARAELTAHVVIKGVQAGSLLSLVLTPAYLLVRKRFTPSFAQNIAIVGKRGVVGAVIGTAVASGMLAAKWSKIDDYGFFDRALRLRHNRGQNRVDTITLGSGVLGLAAGVANRAASMPPVWRALGGASIGVGLGVIAHAATSALMKPE